MPASCENSEILTYLKNRLWMFSPLNEFAAQEISSIIAYIYFHHLGLSLFLEKTRVQVFLSSKCQDMYLSLFCDNYYQDAFL